VTLAKGANETVAHGLSTTPDYVVVTQVGTAGTATIQGTIACATKDATYINLLNTGEDTINGEAYAIYMHSTVR